MTMHDDDNCRHHHHNESPLSHLFPCPPNIPLPLDKLWWPWLCHPSPATTDHDHDHDQLHLTTIIATTLAQQPYMTRHDDNHMPYAPHTTPWLSDPHRVARKCHLPCLCKVHWSFLEGYPCACWEPPGFCKPLTCTCKNPHLWTWVRVLMGTGAGYSGKPQGSLWHSLAAKQIKNSHPQQSLSAITDFVSFFTADEILPSETHVDLASHEHEAFTSFCLLTAVDHHRFHRPQTFDLRNAPESYHEALARPDADVWHVAMHRELDSLEERKAFERTTLPLDRKAIGLRWCYAYKSHPDGSIIRGKEKAHLVTQGFSQRPEDYGLTYLPVVKITSIHITLAYATHHDLEIMSFDVKTTFLHAKLSTVIYCKQILGFPEAESSMVLHLLVVLYSLRQSSYEFYTLLCCLMTCHSLGMTCCEVDHAVFLWSMVYSASWLYSYAI